MQDYSALVRLLPIWDVYHYFKDNTKTQHEFFLELKQLSKQEILELAILIRSQKL